MNSIRKQLNLISSGVLFSMLFLSIPLLSHADTELKADLVAGQAYAAKKCDRCHGESGVSDDSDTPHLASQPPLYLLKQMQDYKSKARMDKNMYKRVRKLKEQQMVNIAAWYASQPLPELTAIDENLKVPSLVSTGDVRRSIPPCAICHGKNGKSGIAGEIPTLAGQHADYLISTMENFRDSSRANDIGAAVQTIIKKLSDIEIEAIARYYSALGGRQNQ